MEAEDEKLAAALKGNVIKEEEDEDEADRVSLEESEQEEEEEEKPKKRPHKPAKGAKKKKGGAKNMDLIREAGVGGFVNDYFAGASGVGKGSGKGLASMLGSGFTALNTIEEEKHETQTSNYFRDAAGGAGGVITESERDYDNTHLRGSKILDDPDLINTSSKLGGSPHRAGDPEFDFKHHQQHSSAKQSTKSKAAEILVDQGTPSGGKRKKPVVRSDEKKRIKVQVEDEDYEMDDDEDENEEL